MNPLQQRILDQGVVKSAAALDASGFLTKQLDVALLNWCAQAIAEHYRDAAIDKVVTIEAGGIAIGTLTALALGKPLVVCKKAASILDNAALLTAEVKSFTKNTQYTLTCDARHLTTGERLLFVDDFLAHGQALQGMQSVCRQAGATLAGVGIVVEKSFQSGRALADELALPVHSLARLKALEPAIEFL
ncbi:xanthine phosphoribosyltransferase [Ferrimonas balearica]|uniref:xanthine phosphoribosyltransferase n=1 Tax=Ferrimonas balearica TaxID=44012 RepID=UPI001C9938EB|nr:xanthine phosphoribosyltransferase [Ferrimonas balearica]MBY5992867.1 xanthine phosphoribosyltransferase [Ferrimonas balearica]